MGELKIQSFSYLLAPGRVGVEHAQIAVIGISIVGPHHFAAAARTTLSPTNAETNCSRYRIFFLIALYADAVQPLTLKSSSEGFHNRKQRPSNAENFFYAVLWLFAVVVSKLKKGVSRSNEKQLLQRRRLFF